MRKILIISLLSIKLLGNTEFGQLLRIPELLSHFFQHHRVNPEISFLEFLQMHYGGNDGTSADDAFDRQLPCHDVNHLQNFFVQFSPMIPETPSFVMEKPEPQRFRHSNAQDVFPKHVFPLLHPPCLS